MSKKLLFYTLFFALLSVGFYFSLKALMPNFFKKRIAPIAHVQPFAFTNQDGNMVTQEAIKNKVAIVNFFFTTCNSICPRMMNNLRPSYETFKNKEGVIFLSFTSDPARDSVSVLKKWAEDRDINTGKWIFLTGRKNSLYTAARHSFKLDDPKNFVSADSMAFLHTQFIALVNRKGDVVKIYDGLKPSELKLVEEDVNNLLKD